MNIKEVYHKYIHWIVILLFVLLSFKSCQSCSRDRALKYQTVQYQQNIDSLSTQIVEKIDTIYILKDSIKMYRYKLGIVEDNNRALKESNRHYRSTNSRLVDANKNLSNKKEE